MSKRGTCSTTMLGVCATVVKATPPSVAIHAIQPSFFRCSRLYSHHGRVVNVLPKR